MNGDFQSLFGVLDISKSDKSGILSMIQVLKTKRPPKWRVMAHRLTNELAKRDGVFEREFPKRRALELLGRKYAKRIDCPDYDDFSDESKP